MSKLKVRNTILLFLTAFIWGVAFVAQSVGMDYVGPFTFNCVRSLIGGIVLIPCIWLLRKNEPEKSSVNAKKEDKKLLLTGGILCGILLGAATNFQQVGIAYTTVGKAGFITAFYIIIVPILGLFLKKKCAPSVWVGVVLALAGLYFLCITEELSVGKGDALVFVCAILFSIHILVIDHFTELVDGVKMSCIQFFVCGIISAVPMLLFEEPRMSGIIAAWQPILYAGVLSCGVAYTLQIVGQKGMNPTVASLILSLESVISVLAGMVLLGQHLSTREMLGCVLMFGAIILAQLPQKKGEKSRNMKKWKSKKKTGIVVSMLVVALGMLVLTGCQDEKALKNQKAYRKVGINKMEEGDYEGAVASFQKALDQSFAEVGEMEIDICYYKAAAQYKSGDVEGAMKTYEALMNYDKNNSSPYYLRGCIYLKAGQMKKAQKDFGKALELGENNYELYISVYENLMGIGETEEAEAILDKALKFEGDGPEDYRERGHVYLLKGDYENARKELDKAINKEDTKALLYMAQVYEAQGNKDQAKALYESYTTKHGSDSEALNTLGEMQMETGNYQQALEFFQQALAAENVINEQALRKNEIMAYERLNDFTSAKEKMESYVKDYPDDEQAQREFVFLQTR